MNDPFESNKRRFKVRNNLNDFSLLLLSRGKETGDPGGLIVVRPPALLTNDLPQLIRWPQKDAVSLTKLNLNAVKSCN